MTINSTNVVRGTGEEVLLAWGKVMFKDVNLARSRFIRIL